MWLEQWLHQPPEGGLTSQLLQQASSLYLVLNKQDGGLSGMQQSPPQLNKLRHLSAVLQKLSLFCWGPFPVELRFDVFSLLCRLPVPPRFPASTLHQEGPLGAVSISARQAASGG